MKIFNFSAGPGVLSKEVLVKVQNEMLDYGGTGCSIIELSHRSTQFRACLDKAERDFRTLLDIPSNYKVLFMQGTFLLNSGGASSQFSTVVYNMITDLSQPVDYIVTGCWSEKAAEEASRLGVKVNIVVNTVATNHDGSIPQKLDGFSTDPAFIYYCENETVHGVEMPQGWEEKLPKGVDLVCDMSSNLLSRPVNVSKFAIIYGGAQKNIGPSGVTLVIVREDLLDRFETNPIGGPSMMSYKICSLNGSMYNTPPTFAIYVSGLTFQWLLDLGGLTEIARINTKKAEKVYDALYAFKALYRPTVVDPIYRSKMNVPFRILKDGIPNEEKEKDFLKEAEKLGCMSLAGHRSVGGIRASLYNALEMEAVDTLITLIYQFGNRQ